MAKTKPNPFAKIKAQDPTPGNQPPATVEVKTTIRKNKKTGRPAAFDEPTSRLTTNIPTSTLKAMQRHLPDSTYSSQSQFINDALLKLLYQIELQKEERA